MEYSAHESGVYKMNQKGMQHGDELKISAARETAMGDFNSVFEMLRASKMPVKI